jgi:hypothetical protein
MLIDDPKTTSETGDDSPALRRRHRDEEFLGRLDALLEIIDPDRAVSGRFLACSRR